MSKSPSDKPPAVEDVEAYWSNPPMVPSDRCIWWVKQIENGWYPNRRINQLGYYLSAEFYGVYIYEYINVLSPLIEKVRTIKEMRKA